MIAMTNWALVWLLLHYTKLNNWSCAVCRATSWICILNFGFLGRFVFLQNFLHIHSIDVGCTLNNWTWQLEIIWTTCMYYVDISIYYRLCSFHFITYQSNGIKIFNKNTMPRALCMSWVGRPYSNFLIIFIRVLLIFYYLSAKNLIIQSFNFFKII